MTFDPTKPVVARCGAEAEILATDITEYGYPIVAKLTFNDGTKRIQSYRRDGRVHHTGNSSDDLFNVPEKVTRWVYWNRKSETFDLLVIPPSKETLGPLDTCYPIEIEVGRKE